MKKSVLVVAIAILTVACAEQGDPVAPPIANETVPPDDKRGADEATTAPVVPARFQGRYAPDRRACAEDYTYQPAFQNVTITASEVRFFETGGPVTDVKVEGDSIAVTLRETVGDTETTRAIYLALNGDGTARYRAESSRPPEDYVVCEAA